MHHDAANPTRIHIAGVDIALQDAGNILTQLRDAYAELQNRFDAFRGDSRNPHLCRAGCSHCCRRGAVFAVTLVEAIEWSMAITGLPRDLRSTVVATARTLMIQQHAVFAACPGRPDTPGDRDEAMFSRRIAQLNAAGPACPLLQADLCSVYDRRPLLCRAYGYPVDAYAVEAPAALVFRSLCLLYEGMSLADYVRARDIKAQMSELSIRLGGGRDWGRFTSVEAILAVLG